MASALGTPVVRVRLLTTVGVVALASLALLVLLLDHWVGFDERVWRTVLLLRGTHTDVAVDRVVDLATPALTLLLAAAVVAHVRARGVVSAWPWLVTCGLGLLGSKTLKHVLTRERPSSLPDVALGYSFPSAHVMNSLAAVLAVVGLTYALRHRRLWWAAAAALASTVMVGRILLARHWAFDVAGGVLAAFALVGLVVPIVIRRPLVGPLALALVLTAILAADRRLEDAGLRLPTPLVGYRRALVEVDVGADLRSQLSGDWREAATEQPGGSLVWLEGAGTIAIDVPAETPANGKPIAGSSGLRLALNGRPAVPLGAGTTATIAVNGQVLARFVPFEGWRQYRVTIPPGLVHAGRNEVGIAVLAEGVPRRFAVAGLRLAAALPE